MRFNGRLWACGAILVTGVMLTGCDPQTQAVATVGGATITEDDYLNLLEQAPGARGMPAGQSAMSQLIDNALLTQEAQRQKVAPSQADIESAMNYFRSRPDYQQQKQQTGLSDEQIMELFIKPQMSMAALAAKMAGVTDADVTNYFNQHKAELGEPEQVRARVLTFTDKKKADAALALVGKSSPEEIARTVTGDPNAAQIVSLRKQGSPFPQAVVDAAFKTPKGEHTGIIEAAPAMNFLQPQTNPQAKSYYIVMVEEKVPARAADLKNALMRSNIQQILAQQKIGTTLTPTAFQDMVANLRTEAIKNHQIQMIRPSLKSLETAPPPAPTPGGMVAP